MTLNLFLGLPIMAGLAAYLMRDKAVKPFAGLISLIQLIVGVKLVTGNPAELKFLSPWIPELGLNWSLGIDGANVLLVILTPIITYLAVMSVAKDTPRCAGFVASLLLLDGFLSGLFLSQNLGLFYIFFEAMLLPALILIGGWSRKDGAQTALKFLLFTLIGSLPMLLGVLALAFSPIGGDSLEFSELTAIAREKQLYLFFPFLMAFLVKMPMVPFHGWLPTLYRNAPASVTVVIAALMSKAGTYGLFKVGFTVFPEALREYSGTLAVLAVVSILYGAIAALGADSVREVLAFSSLSHIAMIGFGIASFKLNGAAGAGLQMAAHAVATGGLFLVVAFLERRQMPDQLRRYGGLAALTPKLAALTLFLTLAALGQPGLGSFPGELYILTGTWPFFPSLTILASVGIVLAAGYLLRWYQKMFNGDLGTYRTPEDLSNEECILLAIPISLSLAMGFCPSLFLAPVQAWLEGKL
jgi:NADH-quinone oxidoreductase subunit M